MAKKPGVMLYFELLQVVRSLTNEEKGCLLEAILIYGRDGEEQDLPGRLQILWPLIRSRLDVDSDRYNKTVIRKRYAAYVRYAKQNGNEPLDYLSWQIQKGYSVVDGEYHPEETEYLTVI